MLRLHKMRLGRNTRVDGIILLWRPAIGQREGAEILWISISEFLDRHYEKPIRRPRIIDDEAKSSDPSVVEDS
jgi:hypothetical protein